jgi:hypothetical protein
LKKSFMLVRCRDIGSAGVVWGVIGRGDYVVR